MFGTGIYDGVPFGFIENPNNPRPAQIVLEGTYKSTTSGRTSDLRVAAGDRPETRPINVAMHPGICL